MKYVLGMVVFKVMAIFHCVAVLSDNMQWSTADLSSLSHVSASRAYARRRWGISIVLFNLFDNSYFEHFKFAVCDGVLRPGG